MKRKLIFLALRIIVTAIAILFSCGFTAVYQVLIDCSKGNIAGALLIVATMALASWLCSGLIVDEMRKENSDTYTNQERTEKQ